MQKPDVIFPLPYYGYQDNEDVQGFIEPFQMALRDCLVISDWLTTSDFTPPTLEILKIDFSKIDYYAYLLGYYTYFWRRDWTDYQKIQLLLNADDIWNNRGTERILSKIFTILNLPFSIYTINGGFFCDISKCDTGVIGEHSPLFAFIRLPTSKDRVKDWGDYRYILDRFVPIHTQATLCYDEFRCNLSVVGEPIFI